MEMENKSMLVDLCVVFGLVTEPVIPVKELSKCLGGKSRSLGSLWLSFTFKVCHGRLLVSVLHHRGNNWKFPRNA